MGTDGRMVPQSPPGAVAKMRAASRLIEKGVGVFDADALLGACASDAELVLLTLPRARFGGLREGDTVRTSIAKQPRTVRVELVKLGVSIVAVVGRPIESTSRDDVSTDLAVRRRA